MLASLRRGLVLGLALSACDRTPERPWDASLDASDARSHDATSEPPTPTDHVPAADEPAAEAPPDASLDASPEASRDALVDASAATSDGATPAPDDAATKRDSLAIDGAPTRDLPALPDAAPDAPRDVAREPGVDARADAAPDVPFDAPLDLGADVPREGGADLRPDAAPPPPPRVVLSPAGAVWRYLDDGSAPGADWTAPTFRDGAWRTGAAQLGYGDGDEATVVRYGPDPANKHVTTYFRRTFTVDDPRAWRFYVLRLLRDDGAVVYLNGREVRRDHLPDGDVTATTLAALTVAAPEESVFHERLVDPTLLVAGSNTLAVEVHQSTRDSSDLSFDLELVGLRASLVEPEADPTILAVGDIATCRNDFDEATARILDAVPGPVVTLGDSVYDVGSELEFMSCFEPTWGRHRARIRPAVGNHEYYTPGAAPYYRYFGAAAGDPARGYYSYDLGAWHLIALNSNCAEVGGCNVDSPQDRWLAADLAASRARCTLAYWHHPYYTSGVHGPAADMGDLFRRLHAGGVDVVLTGHEHDYERFAPQDALGNADPARGIRSFVVGTGGVELRWFPSVAVNSEVRDVATHGVLRLVLRPTGYAWRFLPVAGSAFTDGGEGACH